MVWAAALLFAVNGAVSKVVLESGLSTLRLTELRSIGAAAGLALLVAVVARRGFRVSRRELPWLVLLGVGGLAFVQWFYFIAIGRLPIGIALLLVALWARFAVHEPVRRRIWAALALALAGLGLVVRIWNGLSLDGVGVTAALGSALAYAVYVLLAERAVGRRDALSLSLFAFAFSALFWVVLQPIWSFPLGTLSGDVSLLGNLEAWDAPAWLLAGWVVVL